MSLSVRHSASIAVLVAGAFFMENLDGTIIATALPQMAQSFHVGPVSLNWRNSWWRESSRASVVECLRIGERGRLTNRC
jgi:hypothetical protein